MFKLFINDNLTSPAELLTPLTLLNSVAANAFDNVATTKTSSAGNCYKDNYFLVFIVLLLLLLLLLIATMLTVLTTTTLKQNTHIH